LARASGGSNSTWCRDQIFTTSSANGVPKLRGELIGLIEVADGERGMGTEAAMVCDTLA
jgi:hypothetical protein